MARDDAGPLAHDMDPGAARPHPRHPGRGEQLRPRIDARRRHKIGGKARPITAIVVLQRLDPALLRCRIRRLHRIEDEQRPSPPADLVVGEIADAIGGVAIGSDELAGERHHPRLGLGRERVEPVKAGVAAEFEIDDGRQAQLLRRQGPAPRTVEPPGGEPPAGRLDPRLFESERTPSSCNRPCRSVRDTGSRRRAR